MRYRDVQWSTADPELSPLTSSENLPATAKDYVLEVGRRAMACEFQRLLNAGQHTGAIEAATEALDLLERLEDQLTIYRSHSEMSCLNRDALERPCVVERQLFGLLTRCADLAFRHRRRLGYHGGSAGEIVGVLPTGRPVSRPGQIDGSRCNELARSIWLEPGSTNRAIRSPGDGDQSGQCRQGVCAGSLRGDSRRSTCRQTI